MIVSFKIQNMLTIDLISLGIKVGAKIGKFSG